jgi:hypothetical protein
MTRLRAILAGSEAAEEVRRERVTANEVGWFMR